MEEEIIETLRSDVDAALVSLNHDLQKLRTGRANLSLLDGITIDYYGTPTPLSQCANLTVADARLIVVKPWDRSLGTAIERAIQTSNLGITPQSDGEAIRLPIPSLTEERRRDLVKQGKGRAEDAKVSIRNARRDANDLLKTAEKDKEIGQDDLKRAMEKVQEATDLGIKQIDKVIAAKEKEILEI